MPAHTHTYSKSSTSTTAASGNTGSHTLTVDEMPSHAHNVTSDWGRDSGGSGWGAQISNYSSGYILSPSNILTYMSNTGGNKGHVHSLNSHKHTITLTSTASGSVGSGASINKVQSSKVVIRWHRIA